MKEPPEITKEQAERIRDEWHRANKPRRPLTITDHDKYYDVRELTIDELIIYIKEKTGKIITREQLGFGVIACYR